MHETTSEATSDAASESDKSASDPSSIQVLRTRDDTRPALFSESSSEGDSRLQFSLAPGSTATWAQADEPFGTETLRQRIEPWLTALVQAEHLSLLVGSGLTTAVHSLVSNKPPPSMDLVDFGPFSNKINSEAKRAALSANRGEGNLEDQLRAASELLRGLQILNKQNIGDVTAASHASTLHTRLQEVLRQLAESILAAERELSTAESECRSRAFGYLVSFLMSFASRTGTRERLHLFTTNYDRYIEAAADVAGLRLLDRFVGALAPVFRATKLDIDYHYNPPCIRGEPRYLEGVARYTKLHGSIDWVAYDDAVRRTALPFGAASVEPYMGASSDGTNGADSLMIYPNSAKDRETSFYPFVELFRDFATAVCRPNSTLVTYGYSFGDEHINRAIVDMLTIPSSHLVIIAYTDPLNRIMRIYEELAKPAQISLLVGNHVADLSALVDHYLPKPAIDRTSIRMADLLKARWHTPEAHLPHSSGDEQDAGREST